MNLINTDLGTMHNSSGVLKYTNTDGHRLVLECDKDLAAYYRTFIPKSFGAIAPRWPPHITIVRAGKEIPDIAHWGKYEGKEVPFKYGNIICWDSIYFWLRCFCVQLEGIRTELGLPVESVYTRPPDGHKKIFHMTIANLKIS